MQTVSIKAEIKNEDGSQFADFAINYYGADRTVVHAIEEQLIGMQSNLLAVAKEVEARKKEVAANK